MCLENALDFSRSASLETCISCKKKICGILSESETSLPKRTRAKRTGEKTWRSEGEWIERNVILLFVQVKVYTSFFMDRVITRKIRKKKNESVESNSSPNKPEKYTVTSRTLEIRIVSSENQPENRFFE